MRCVTPFSDQDQVSDEELDQLHGHRRLQHRAGHGSRLHGRRGLAGARVLRESPDCNPEHRHARHLVR